MAKIKMTEKKGMEYLFKLSKAWNNVNWSILYLPSEIGTSYVELHDNGKFKEVYNLIKEIFGDEKKW